MAIRKMKIAVHGLWHLGVVTCAGLLKLGYQVVAFDRNSLITDDLKKSKLPVNEPGVLELLQTYGENIVFTDNVRDLENCEIHWITYDTPVLEDDRADPEFVISEIKKWIEESEFNSEIIISSQLPIGSSKKIRRMINEIRPNNNMHLNVQPENLRLGKALETFLNPDRIVLGTESGEIAPEIVEIFSKLNVPIISISPESAEMVKHAINAFLATSITFMGEIAEICEITGANAQEVESGLKSDFRIGARSYLSPGIGFAGGTLARDVQYLTAVQKNLRPASLLNSLLPSNKQNNDWVYNSIQKVHPSGKGLRILLLGITYTAGTNTLRRSSSIELAKKLQEDGGKVFFYEDEVIDLPDGVQEIMSKVQNPIDIQGFDVAVVGKNLVFFDEPQITDLYLSKISNIIDPSGILKNRINLKRFPGKYHMVGVNNFAKK
jgi:UDPglucose 6-dehydrogenase